jgi:hypothetical protein
VDRDAGVGPPEVLALPKVPGPRSDLPRLGRLEVLGELLASFLAPAQQEEHVRQVEARVERGRVVGGSPEERKPGKRSPARCPEQAHQPHVAALDTGHSFQVISPRERAVPGETPSKPERLVEFYRRLRLAPAARTFEEAYELICSTLNAVEDELTDIPYDPDRWQEDGRLYPPFDDHARAVPGNPRLRRFRSLAHNTYIGDNGAFEIRSLVGEVELDKPGADGKGVWDR